MDPVYKNLNASALCTSGQGASEEQEHCALSVIAVLESVAQEMTNNGTKYFCKSCGTETRCVLSHYQTVTECTRAALKCPLVLSFLLVYCWPQFSHC